MNICELQRELFTQSSRYTYHMGGTDNRFLYRDDGYRIYAFQLEPQVVNIDDWELVWEYKHIDIPSFAHVAVDIFKSALVDVTDECQKRDPIHELREKAMAKLTPDEQRALGLAATS
jgi:hypothetical protein